jgi:hypothetical protein
MQSVKDSVQRVKKHFKKDQATKSEIPSHTLLELCRHDVELEKAMSYFLICEPPRQIPQHDVKEVEAKAEKLIKNGDELGAKIEFGLLAQIGIHNQDKEMARRALESLEKIDTSSSADKIGKKSTILLKDLDKTLAIAKAYYQHETADRADIAKKKREAEAKRE